MKRIYKRLTALLLAFVLCFGINVYNPKADAYVSISATSSVSIGGGVSVSVTIGGDNISAYTLWVSYDASVLQYNSGSGAIVNGGGGTVAISGTSPTTVNLSFTAIANGSCGIYASGEVLSIEGEVINTSYGSASVTVSTPDTPPSNNNSGGGNSGGGNSGGGNSGGGNSNQQTDDRSSNCYLSSLEISPGTLEPEFAVDTYDYTVRVEDGVKEIAITAIPEDDEASTSVRGNTDLEAGENTVEVIVTAENGAVKKYTLNVIVGEILEDVVININGMDYSIVNSDEELQPPENFTKTTIKYDKWDILAYKSPNEKITLLCLANEQDTYKWFIYDEVNNNFIEYKEYSAKYNRYIILPFPENAVYPEGFVLSEVLIFGEMHPAYQNTEMMDSTKYIIYGMNLDGDEGYYVFDTIEKTFMTYFIPEVATESDAVATPVDVEVEPTDNDFDFLPDFLTRNVMFYIICGAAALLLVFLICLIAFGCKIGSLNREIDDLEEETEKLEPLVAEGDKTETKNRTFEEMSLDEETATTDENPDEEISENTNADSEVADSEDVVETVEDNSDSSEIEEIPHVEEIPMVSFDLADEGVAEEYEEQSKEINDIVNDENYDADKDSAF